MKEAAGQISVNNIVWYNLAILFSFVFFFSLKQKPTYTLHDFHDVLYFILVHFLAVCSACLLTLSTVLASQSFWFNSKSLSSNLEIDLNFFRIFFYLFVFFPSFFFWFLFTYFLWLWHSILATPFTRLPTLIRVPVQVRVKGPAASATSCSPLWDSIRDHVLPFPPKKTKQNKKKIN